LHSHFYDEDDKARRVYVSVEQDKKNKSQRTNIARKNELKLYDSQCSDDDALISGE